MGVTVAEAYRILELEPGASPKEVQEAFRRAALRTHPDHAGPPSAGEERRWLRVRDAYEYLRDAGFPELEKPAPPPSPAAPRIGPKPYRAPEWLERQWASRGNDRLGEYFRMDEHERHALRQVLWWTLMLLGGGLAIYYGWNRARSRREWSPSPGWAVRW